MNITDIKTGVAVSAGTVSTGVGTWFEWLPTDIGKLATLIGLILSIVLIFVHVRKSRLDAKKSKLEHDILTEKLRRLRDQDPSPQ